MTPQIVTYTAEGRDFHAELFVPPTDSIAPRPAVLVLHDGAGLGDHARRRAARLAELGYVALAPDLYGEVLSDRAKGVAIIQALVADAPRLRGRARGAFDLLRARPEVDPHRIAAIGFCFGGAAALELARDGADLRAVVAFHGGLRTPAPADRGAVRATLLALAGADDPFIDEAQRAAFAAEMTAARADWALTVYGGAQHAFAQEDVDPAKFPGSAYDPRTDRRAWRTMLDLFEERLGPTPGPRSAAVARSAPAA